MGAKEQPRRFRQERRGGGRAYNWLTTPIITTTIQALLESPCERWVVGGEKAKASEREWEGEAEISTPPPYYPLGERLVRNEQTHRTPERDEFELAERFREGVSGVGNGRDPLGPDDGCLCVGKDDIVCQRNVPSL